MKSSKVNKPLVNIDPQYKIECDCYELAKFKRGKKYLCYDCAMQTEDEK